jgi:hypothetical protein
MSRLPSPTPEPSRPVDVRERNRLEIIRFASDEDQIQAIGVLLERGMLNCSSTREDTWSVYTPVALKLRELGVPFEWLTEHAY